MTHKLDTDDLFIHRIQFHAARRGLNFFLVDPLWVETFSQAYAKDELKVKVLLNMHSEHHKPEDPFTRLVRLAAQKGARVIDPPDVALAAFDKASFHSKAIAAGLQVPHTVIVPGALAGSFQLSEEARAALGSPFVIKPSLGYGRKGVILDAQSEADLRRSVAEWPGCDYLLQRRMTPEQTPGGLAYFRVYFAFGKIWKNWWDCYSDRSRRATQEEIKTLGLHALDEIVSKLAKTSGMQFFSSEILRSQTGEFVVIDYVNDQCHMLSQSSDPRIGVPDDVVQEIAEELVEGAARLAMS
ncbi:MAG: hypothetical protein FJ405_14435 [Verrucomicrobia bacterium]|nr:hypothetical protein [Verrucomicrobiota bacterium]